MSAPLSFRLSDKYRAALETNAKRRGLKTTELLQRLVWAYLEAEGDVTPLPVVELSKGVPAAPPRPMPPLVGPAVSRSPGHPSDDLYGTETDEHGNPI